MKKVSLIVPCYNEEESLPLFYKELIKVSKQLSKYQFEYIFVDDGSKDETLKILKDMAEEDKRVKYLSFSRNFGKESAIYAGISNCSGEYVALLDADMQDPPKLLMEMFSIIENEDYDCVGARRVNRIGEPPIRSFFAKIFYKIINMISQTEIVDGARDFRLMKKCVADAILEVKEYNRFSKGIFSWVGFKTKWISYENTERIAGTTKWSFWKLFLYSLEGIVAFSTIPLAISSIIGILFFVIAIIAIIIVIIKTLIWGDPVAGWPALTCIIFMISGIQLFCFGIMGQYLSKTYLETKNRPIYLLKEKNFN